MNRSTAARAAWAAWAWRFGLPSAAVALGSVWLIPVATGVVVGVAITALLVFCLTMPSHQGSRGRKNP
ncbi:hypothetical protein [Streptomyces sp. NPDC002547]